MEYWSVEIKRHQSFRHYSNTPVLQYSVIIEVESSHGGLPYFLDYRSEKDLAT
jgi:hypothetical protein